MSADMDINSFLEHIQGLKPPFECPVTECGKVYKSYSGIQYHLLNFDHDNPENNTPVKQATPASKKKGHWKKGNSSQFLSTNSPKGSPIHRDSLSYAEAQRLVEIDVNGKIHRLNIYEPLEIVPENEEDNIENMEKEAGTPKMTSLLTPLKNKQKGKTKGSKSKNKKEIQSKELTEHKVPTVPQASFRILENYAKRRKAPARPNSYFRFIEKTAEELDEEVEYDMDEEDFAWLELVNAQRKKDNSTIVNQETFELIMDRFEKEAFFHCKDNVGPPIDDDAVCAICMDGECANSNVILFCDMCNLAVHQECYGVPYIPEGQWLCRRCLQSPSRAVDCCLCPNKGGAFKQTDDGRWAHVVCALWIPEVGFANTVFLEPIDCIDRIPAARWKLTCYICKHKASGACIQCHRNNCYTAFHVTCAQQAGLYMRIEPVKEPTPNGPQMTVKKTAFCDVHAPCNAGFQPMIDNSVASDEDSNSLSAMTPAEAKAQSRQKMRRARKELAEKRNAIPMVSIPTISPKKLNTISSRFSMKKKDQFLNKMLSYWTLKRQSRNGVPLLRRLQTCHMSRSREQGPSDKESMALREQLKYWQKLRQDLERARLLIELIRKREKMKREQLRLQQLCLEMQLTPFLVFVRHALDQLVELDTMQIFLEPVDAAEVPDYLTVIKQPMDLRSIREKLESFQYSTMDQFEEDFDLVWSNCLKYNNKDTPFYRAGCKLRDQGGIVVRAARRMASRVGYNPETGMHTSEVPPDGDCREPMILDDETLLSAEGRKSVPLEEQLRLLLDRLDQANSLHPYRKAKLAKQLQKEISKVRRQLHLGEDRNSTVTSEGDLSQSIMSPMSSTENSNAPTTPAPVEEDPSTPTTRRGMKAGRRTRSYITTPPSSPKPTTSRTVKASPVKSPAGEVHEGKRKRRASSHEDLPQLSPKRSRTIVSSDMTPTSPIPRHKDSFRHYRLHGDSELEETTASSNQSFSESSSQDDEDSESGDSSEQPPSPHPKTSTSHASHPRTPGRGRSRGRPRQKAMNNQRSILQYLSKGECANSKSVVQSPDSLGGSERPMTPSDDFGVSPRGSMGTVGGGASSSVGSNPNSEAFVQECEELSQHLAGLERRYQANRDSYRVEGWYGDRLAGSPTEIPVEETAGTDLETLDLVWAKCRGYPWYPALLVNPKMPKSGCFHNGVPIPVPTEEVLALQRRHENRVFLVLFFDTKRTWQWLPRNKLEHLGTDPARDKAKLLESKKPSVRKAVRKAYEAALDHRARVTGEANTYLPTYTDSPD